MLPLPLLHHLQSPGQIRHLRSGLRELTKDIIGGGGMPKTAQRKQFCLLLPQRPVGQTPPPLMSVIVLPLHLLVHRVREMLPLGLLPVVEN